MSRLKDLYKDEIVDAMIKKFGYKNIMEVPKLDKIVINMGVGEAKDNAKALEAAVKDLEIIAGQKVVTTKAKKITKKANVEELVVEEDEEIDATPVQSDDVNEVETAPWDDDTDEEIDLFDEDNEDDEEPFDEEVAKATIRPAFKVADAETKKIIKGILNGAKLADVHDEKTLKAILEALA